MSSGSCCAARRRWLDLKRPGLAAVRRTMGWSPLHLAAMDGQCGLIERLVSQHDCALTARSANSWTPLHYAAAHNQVGAPPCLRAQGCLMLRGMIGPHPRMLLHPALQRGRHGAARSEVQGAVAK